MKKNLLGILAAFYLLMSVGCNKTELTGTSSLTEASKSWISASWGGISVDFVDSTGTEKRIFKFEQMIDNPNELQTYDCHKIFFGSSCSQYQTQSISLLGKWVADNKADSLVIKYSLAQANVPDDIIDILTVQLADKSNQSADLVRQLNPVLSDSLQVLSPRMDSIAFGSKMYKNVYYYNETDPSLSVFYTKTDGVVAFKINGKTWFK
jgi:hypothetical protein